MEFQIKSKLIFYNEYAPQIFHCLSEIPISLDSGSEPFPTGARQYGDSAPASWPSAAFCSEQVAEAPADLRTETKLHLFSCEPFWFFCCLFLTFLSCFNFISQVQQIEYNGMLFEVTPIWSGDINPQ